MKNFGKRHCLMAFLALCVVIPVAGRNRGEEAAMQVIERVTQKHKLPVTLSIKKIRRNLSARHIFSIP